MGVISKGGIIAVTDNWEPQILCSHTPQVSHHMAQSVTYHLWYDPYSSNSNSRFTYPRTWAVHAMGVIRDRHTITSTRVYQLLIYNRTPGTYTEAWKWRVSFSIQHAYFLQIHRRTESFSTAGGHGRVHLLQKEAQRYSPLLCLAMPEKNPSYQVSLLCLPHSVR